MLRGLVFYDRSADFLEYYSAQGGRLARLGELASGSRRHEWSRIIPGVFYNRNFSGLLCYEARTGTGHFCLPFFDGAKFSPGFRTEHTGWRGSWTLILAGHFGGPLSDASNPADLVFYDASAGTGEFYTVDNTVESGVLLANIRHLRTHTGWRSSWTSIVPGNFGGDGLTDLLFYEGSSGVAEFYTVEREGGLRLLAGHSGWRTSWRQVVPGNFGGSSRTDLLFYDPTAGLAEVYATEGGQIQLLHRNISTRTTWMTIVPGDFAANGRTSLLFYDATAGIGEFYDLDQGRMRKMTQHSGWRRSWSIIAPFDCEARGGGGF